MKCVVCLEELEPHELPRPGLPPLCTRCARANLTQPGEHPADSRFRSYMTGDLAPLDKPMLHAPKSQAS